MTTTASVHDVVAFLLAKSGSHLSMSAIHKMSYYAQGWHLAWLGVPLFDEQIQARATGPVVPALYPLQKDGYTESSWPAGDAAAIDGPTATIVEAVYDTYGHLTGLTMGGNAKQEAPYRLAQARSTEENPTPAIQVADMKAFFKAFNDAPEDRVAYANRFMADYADAVVGSPRPVEHTLIGPTHATASLGDEDHAGWYWKCSCGAKAASFIGNWPESVEEARDEWRLHQE